MVVRAVSDSAKEDLPIDFSLTLSKRNEISVAKVVVQLLKNPLALPALVRFGNQSRQAAERLARFLDGYVLVLGNVVEEGRPKKVVAS